jgi:hypothetical protein
VQRWVEKYFNDDQNAGRKELSEEILERLNTEPHFLTRVITGNESWFYEYDPETKRESEELHTPVSKTEESLHEGIKIKITVITFFDSRGVVQKEFLPLCVTVGQKYYLDALGLLRKRTMRVLTEIAKDWIH